MPHQPVLQLEPFLKWGLNFTGPFKLPMTQICNKYIVVATDCCMKWVEAKALRDNTSGRSPNSCMNTYGVDLVARSSLWAIKSVTFSIIWSVTSPPFTWLCIRKAQSTILKPTGWTYQQIRPYKIFSRKIVNEQRTDWNDKLHTALWAYHTFFKTSIRSTLFRMAFGFVMPIKFQVSSLRIKIVENPKMKKKSFNGSTSPRIGTMKKKSFHGSTSPRIRKMIWDQKTGPCLLNIAQSG